MGHLYDILRPREIIAVEQEVIRAGLVDDCKKCFLGTAAPVYLEWLHSVDKSCVSSIQSKSQHGEGR